MYETSTTIIVFKGSLMSYAAKKYYAAIDLGSNSCRLLIMQATSQGLKHSESYTRILRLSEGLTNVGYISENAIQRALITLQYSARRLKNYPTVKLRCVATEVCRQASNADDLLLRIRRDTGLEFTTISEQEEARLTALGIAPLLDYKTPYAIVFDVGGGSTEIVLLKLDAGQAPRMLDWMSLPVGVVSIAESQNPENARNYVRLTAMIHHKLENFGEKYNVRDLIAQDKVQLIGSSGTATTAAALHLGLRYYDREKIDGLQMNFTDVENVIKNLQMMSAEERGQHPCIGPERSDLVLGGMAIFEGLSAAWPVGSVKVAVRGVRDGIINELYQRDLAGNMEPSVA